MRLPTGGVTPRELDAYAAESGGGELEVTLTEAQMPIHNHSSGSYNLLLTRDGKETAEHVTGPAQWPNVRRGEVIANTGGGNSRPNMPPYIALYFCKKD